MSGDIDDGDAALRTRMVAAFLGGVRAALTVERQRWTPAYVEQQLALCDRVEQFGPRGAFLVVMLCCSEAEVSLETAVASVEAVHRPA